MTTNAIARGPRAGAERRAAHVRWLRVDSYKEADARRVALLCGVVLLGWFPLGTPLDDVLSALARWSADPSYFASLPYPVCCRPDWEWSPGEDVSVWHAGRLLAVVGRAADGVPVVSRFDRPPSVPLIR